MSAKLCYSNLVRRVYLVLLVLTVSGCRGCKNDHPYVPYSIADEDAAAVASGDAGASAADAGSFSVAAEKAPEGATHWSLEGLSLDAPPGMVFELGVVRDFDGDGQRDAAVLVRRSAEVDLGQVLLLRGEKGALGKPVVLASAPDLPPIEPRCTPSRRLAATGARSLFVELGWECPVPSSREPSRWMGILLVGAAPRLHFSADIVDPPNAPRLVVDADGTDRDGDGIDDVTLRVSLEGGGVPFEPLARITGTVRWFDRSAGMSRDPDEPDASLRSLAGSLAAKAGRVVTAPPVPGQVRALRALYGALCNEGGAPRLRHVLGDAALGCGRSRGLEEAGLAEVRAQVSLADPLLAITAFDHAQVAPATKTVARVADATNWIALVAPASSATSVRTLSAVPLVERGRQPAWGALAFDEAGKLLVRTAAGVVRVDPELGDETDARDVAPWPMTVVSPDGSQRFLEAYNPCDGVALHATLAPTGDGDLVDVPLPIAPTLGARCSGKGEPAAALPLAWGTSGLEVIVSGEPVFLTSGGRASALRGVLGQAVTYGSSRSPDGKSYAVATSQGILVRGPKSRLLRTKELDGTYLEQRDCATANDGAHVACIRAGRAWVATF